MDAAARTSDIYATKGIEYLLVLGFLLLLLLFWRLLNEPAPAGREKGWLRSALSVAGSLLYVLFFPLIGIALLVWMVLRRLLPGPRPRIEALGAVMQDGGEPLESAGGGPADKSEADAAPERSPADKEAT